MKDNLLKFMVDSYERRNIMEAPVQTEMPFITISREHGCQGNTLAHMISRELVKEGQHWDFVNKEILNETAHQLNLTTDHVQKVAADLDRNAIDEILNSFSVKYYKSDRKVRRTIAKVVETWAEAGKVIIVGRGGAAIGKNMVAGLHIRLRAPIPYRLKTLMDRKGLSREEAFSLLSRVDLKRYKFQRDLAKDPGDINDLFHLTFDCSKVTLDEITKMVMTLLKARGVV